MITNVMKTTLILFVIFATIFLIGILYCKGIEDEFKAHKPALVITGWSFILGCFSLAGFIIALICKLL